VYWFNHAGILSGLNWWRDNNGSILLLMGFTQQQAQGTSLAAPSHVISWLLIITRRGFIDWKFAIVISLIS
jgi:hypothetical protein